MYTVYLAHKPQFAFSAPPAPMSSISIQLFIALLLCFSSFILDCFIPSIASSQNKEGTSTLYYSLLLHPWLLLLPPLNPRIAAMEDLNVVAADCVVVCCCCQCLILQILVFALLKFPAKLVKKTRELAKRKLNRRRRGEIGEIVRSIEEEEYCFRVEAERERASVDDDGRHCESCMKEVEKVLMEFYDMGEFAFGSFWGRRRDGEGPRGSVPAINMSTRDQIEEGEKEIEDDDDFVKYQIIEMVGSFK